MMPKYLWRSVMPAAFAASLFAPRLGAQGTSSPPPTAGQVFKNIKVLQQSPAESFGQSMHLVSGALGVNCEYCHVEMDFASDMIPKKAVAREMFRMTADLNQRVFRGNQVVTCYTCHQGHAIPRSTPNLPAPDYPVESKNPSLPAASAILSKYVEALGGEANLHKITSRKIIGRQNIPTGPGGAIAVDAEIEIAASAPDLYYREARPVKGPVQKSGVDANGPWTLDPRGRLSNTMGLERDREFVHADFYQPLDLENRYGNLRVIGIESIGSKPAYVLAGELGGAPVRLYFDQSSGLLLRRLTVVPTVAGNSPFQEDFDQYRDAGHGVKYPYVIRMEPAGPRTEIPTHSTLQIERIEENVSLGPEKFNRPQSSAAANGR